MATRSVTYEFRGRFDDLKSKLTAAGRSVDDFGRKLTALDRDGERMRRGMDHIAGAAGRVGLAATASLAAVSKAAIGWESAWTGVTKTVDGTAEEMAQLEGQLRELARSLPAAHAEIAAVAEAAGQLGIERSNVAAFTRTMIDLGETTNLAAEEAATSLARFMNIMGTGQDQVARLGSALVGLGNSLPATESEILALGMRLAGAGRQAGLTESDVFGLAAAMTSVGIEAEAGGTAMSLTMKRISREVETNGQRLSLYARVAGMTADEFARAWGEDAAAALTAFVQGLGDAERLGMSTNEVLRTLGITGIRESDALLRLSGASDVLTRSIALSSAEFEKNTALVEEADKRYNTTAARIQVAWNQIVDASIEFGAVVLPVIAQAADLVGGLANAVGQLPGPIKTATVGMLGITAVLGSGVWFTAKTVNAVTNMGRALSDLGVSSGRVGGGLSRVAGIMTGPWGLALVGASFALGKFLGSQAEAKARVQELSATLDQQTGAITDNTRQWVVNELERSGVLKRASALGLDLKVVTDAALGQTEALRQLNAEAEKAGQWSSVGVGREDVDRWTALNAILKEIGSTNGTLQQARESMERKAEAAGDAADATKNLAKASDTLADSAEEEARAIEDSIDAMRQKRAEAIRALDAEINYQAALDDARDAIAENGKTLDITTEAGRANKSALLDVAQAWNNLSDAEKNSKGARREAIKQFVELATQMGMSREEARKLAKQLFEIPSKRKVDVEVNTASARTQLESFIRTASGRVIRINAQIAGRPGGPAIARAEGGTVPGERVPYGDKVPALLAPGEEVISNRFGQADRWRPLLKAINANRLADGGTIGYADGGRVTLPTLKATVTLGEVQRESKSLKETLKDLRKEFRASEKAVKRERAERDAIVQARRSLESSVRSKFDSNLFEVGSPWSPGAGDFMSILRQDIRGLRSFNQARSKLSAKGLSGEALAYLLSEGDPDTVQQFAGMSRQELAEFQRVFNRRARLQQQVSSAAGATVYGAAQRAANRELRQANQGLRKIERRLEKVEKAIKEAAKDTGKEVGKSINNAASAGRRNKR